MVDRIRDLVAIHGISGYETPVKNHIEVSLAGTNGTMVTDNLGNLIVSMGSGEDELLFVAHTDELGCIVSEIMDNGFIRIKSLGGIDARVMPGRVVRILTGGGAEVRGVVGITPPHLMSEDRDEAKRVIPFDELYVDIGADSGDEAKQAGMELLLPVTFDKTFEILGGKYLSARGLDDRAGCAILIELIKTIDAATLRKRVHFAFTVQEERGLRGAQLVGSQVKTRYAFAVDSCSSGCIPSSSPARAPAQLGRGPALRVMDNRHISDPAFVNTIKGVANRAAIPVQIVFAGGSTDVAAIEVQGPKCLPICFPVRYTHSPVEVASIHDIEQTRDLVRAIIREYAQ